jgi:tetratricopeptide (TPR) repeat protein
MEEAISAQELISEAGRAYKVQNYRAAAISYQAAAHCYTQKGDKLQAAEMLNNASVAFLQADEPESALQSARGTDQVFAAAGDVRRQAIALGNLGGAFEALGNLESAAEAYQSSADLFMDTDDHELRADVMRSLSTVQLRLGQQMEALATMRAGLDQVENPGMKQKLIQKILSTPFKIFNRLS